MTLGGRPLCIAIPDTVLEEHDSVRDKTTKLGQIARYCSIFGVDVVRVFNDPRGRGESAFIKKVLEYLETPQYLRRRLFPLSDDLRFAGLLPPLRIPSHRARVPLAQVRAGEFREGVVLQDGLSADVGLDQPAGLRQRQPPGKRLTLKIGSNSPLEGVPARRSDVPEYWGYTVEASPAGPMLEDRRFPLKVATSRLGDPLVSALPGIRQGLAQGGGLMLIFGSPSRGLFESLGKDLRKKVGCVVNLFPEQNVATVRSEEAIAAALYLFSVLTAPGFPKFG